MDPSSTFFADDPYEGEASEETDRFMRSSLSPGAKGKTSSSRLFSPHRMRRLEGSPLETRYLKTKHEGFKIPRCLFEYPYLTNSLSVSSHYTLQEECHFRPVESFGD
ncbi:hypothetical protein NPIL_477571 [Nephila pilipes]|uniref:Uncharacterized protein n=1 Tax=Nephila pilipes TaxID=299642 RepID=A0A8X6PU34_NEPPI|nr:hypothetical protein NPIL_477571 [Nephila pilipes]